MNICENLALMYIIAPGTFLRICKAISPDFSRKILPSDNAVISNTSCSRLGLMEKSASIEYWGSFLTSLQTEYSTMEFVRWLANGIIICEI